MGNRAGRRAQPNPIPPYGGGYGPNYYTSGYVLPDSPYQPRRRHQCRGHPPRRYY
jgi:hypothetical protein